MGYTVIQDADIALDATLTTAILTAVRDNTEAIVEGLGSAPSVQLAGLSASTIDGAAAALVTENLAIQPDGQSLLRPFDEYIVHSVTIHNGLTNSNTAGKSDADITAVGFTFAKGGEYTLAILQMSTVSSNDQVGAKILIDDSIILTTAKTSGLNSEFITVLNTTIAAGEELKVKMYGSTTDAGWGFGRVMVLVYSSNPFRDDVGFGQYSTYIAGTQYNGIGAHFAPLPNSSTYLQDVHVV